MSPSLVCALSVLFAATANDDFVSDILYCVPCPRSYCSLCHVNLYVLLLLLLLKLRFLILVIHLDFMIKLYI